MFAHVPKDALDVGVVNQGLLHHLDALAVGVRVTCTGESDRLAYACSAGGVYVVWLALSLTHLGSEWKRPHCVCMLCRWSRVDVRKCE